MVYLSRSGTTDINEALSLYRQIESIIPSAGGITLCGLLCRKRDSESTTVWHQDSGDLENGPTLNERAESKRCVAVDDSVSDVGNDSLPCGVRVESTRPATERDYVEVDFPAAPPFPKRSQTLPRKSVRVTSHPDKGYSMVRLSRLLNNKNPTPDSNRPVYSKLTVNGCRLSPLPLLANFLHYPSPMMRGGVYRGDVYRCDVYKDDVYTGDIYNGDVYNGDICMCGVYRRDVYRGDVHRCDVYKGDICRDGVYRGDVYTGDVYRCDDIYTGDV
ncbi:hypothetical protein LSH36_361g08005 [Paralvinella palmiformis]|uniref:Uncharacterized protein n=1 Tax=Paralvinella palmiformis TaxID=53620 RepID=A0AAD9N276_9ANNE|nr:hypothetical protein LSH36_361g08005 [Paralvinella palmiformis]